MVANRYTGATVTQALQESRLLSNKNYGPLQDGTHVQHSSDGQEPETRNPNTTVLMKECTNKMTFNGIQLYS